MDARDRAEIRNKLVPVACFFDLMEENDELSDEDKEALKDAREGLKAALDVLGPVFPDGPKRQLPKRIAVAVSWCGVVRRDITHPSSALLHEANFIALSREDGKFDVWKDREDERVEGCTAEFVEERVQYYTRLGLGRVLSNLPDGRVDP